MADREQLALLRQGVKIWNQWKTENAQKDIELSGAQLRDASLSSVNLSGANLSDANLIGADLTGADLIFADLSHASLSDANLNSANLIVANLIGADLISANLSGANLSGANLRDANLSGASLGNANVSDTDLIFADLSNADLTLSNLRGANLSGANLSGADLSNADLSGANLNHANLTGANLTGANLFPANFSNANLSDANLSNANLSGANFRDAKLCDAILVATQALATNFRGANLTGACVENWQTDNKTKLDRVICQFVYLRRNQQERYPKIDTFKSGEFAALFQQSLETVDLIFADGLDWKAFFLCFEQLRLLYNSDRLQIQALEQKSSSAFVVRLEVPPEIDKSAIEIRAKELYERQLQVLEARYREELNLTEEEIETYKQQSTDLLEIVKLQASSPALPTVKARVALQSQLNSETCDR
ncbi:MAG: pentapeptide repeat-containing protein [Cyanosarcina radialis HA8281-LM2]|nr:pentapeptide repeat-containing protein [Cyanosarcina radialis HA8281-LM2]